MMSSSEGIVQRYEHDRKIVEGGNIVFLRLHTLPGILQRHEQGLKYR